ncbi:MAG TPA: oxidoreductase, partial [Acidimicrobiales bacterium]|nr:oxidoreductase [Acidimicrobiales bacterium]
RYGGGVAASGLTGGNELSSTVYPFIVRGVALLGIDTVATPIEERRALWSTMAEEFPMQRCAEMVSEVVGLDGLSDALSTVLRGAARGRILVDPRR